jgi:hypothetical protein
VSFTVRAKPGCTCSHATLNGQGAVPFFFPFNEPERHLAIRILEQNEIALRRDGPPVVRQVAIRAARFPTVALIGRLVWP